MNHSGDAAEQIVRMSLEGVEYAVRITGTAAKEIALFLLAALRSPERAAGSNIKLKGKERLNSMLKSGKQLEIFSVKERDLQKFVQGAKEYGIVYCVLRDKNQTPDGLCDILVKADDAPKINRLVERFKFATVDKAKIERDMAAQAAEAPAAPPGAQPSEPEINDMDMLPDGLLGTGGGKAAPEAKKGAADIAAPGAPEPAKTEATTSAPKKSARTAKEDAPAADVKTGPDPLASGGRSTSGSPPPPKTNPSEPSSGSKEISESPILSKPSVKEELREITAAKKAKEAEALKREEPTIPAKAKETPETAHKQPQNRRKPKSEKAR